jgi:hypothetical protein
MRIGTRGSINGNVHRIERHAFQRLATRFRAALYMPAPSAMRYNSAIVALVTSVEIPGPPQTQTDCRGCNARFGAVLGC